MGDFKYAGYTDLGIIPNNVAGYITGNTFALYQLQFATVACAIILAQLLVKSEFFQLSCLSLSGQL